MEKDWSGIAGYFDRRQEYIAGEETIYVIDRELAKLNKLGKVLELGCGNGKYTRQIINAAEHITATDLSGDMLTVAAEKLKDFKNLTLEPADCYKLEYTDETFDSVFMANLIHVVLKPELALKEARRVLRKNGKLIILSFTTDGMTPENIETMKKRYLKVFGAFPEKKSPMLLNDLVKLVKDSGFQVTEAGLVGADTKAMFLAADK